jgi:DNA-directed RNA polymerase subunit K/omega
MEDQSHYTKFERARIIGARALQISANAPILLKIDQETLEKINFDPIKIAEMEFEEKILPITVHRPLPKRIEKHTEEEMVEIIEEEEDKEKRKEEKKAVKEDVAEEVKTQEQTEEEEEPETKEEEVEEEDAGETF